MSEDTKKILALADGVRSSLEIAEQLGLSSRYVRRVCQDANAPRLGCGAKKGELNHQYKCGRRIDHDGYVLVSVPSGGRKRKGRKTQVQFEHRLVFEQKIGRCLGPDEVVDHIDGLTLHNDPDNLRVFDCNAKHLKATISGQAKRHLSAEGRNRLQATFAQRPNLPPVDSYGQRKASGDVRLRQILLAMLQLGTDSPYLLGSSHHIEKAQIDCSSRPKIQQALDDLLLRWA